MRRYLALSGATIGSLVLACAAAAAPAVNYRAHRTPQAVAIGDLNGDGRLDLAVANWDSNDVSVLLGAAGGGFRPALHYRTGRHPLAVAAADLNGDQHLDLAVSNVDSGSVSILLGRGDGTLEPAHSYATGDSPMSLAVADLDGDSHPDVAVANLGSQNLSVLFGKGNGAFRPASSYDIPDIPFSLAAADLNGDGRSDLAVAGGLGVWAIPGKGNGGFGSGDYYRTRGTPWWLAAGDLNGDGRPDLVVPNAEMKGPGHVSVLTARVDRTFRRHDYRAGTSPLSAAIGDLNGDGRADLAVANQGSNDVSVLLGNGDGSFQPAVAYRVQRSPFSVAMGDLNGDGRLDLAVSNEGSDDVSVLLNTGFYPLRIGVIGMPRRTCLRGAVQAHVVVSGAPALSSVDVLLDGKRVMRTTNSQFDVTIRGRRLRPGLHSLVASASETEGGRVDRTTQFRSCR